MQARVDLRVPFLDFVAVSFPTDFFPGMAALGEDGLDWLLAAVLDFDFELDFDFSFSLLSGDFVAFVAARWLYW